MSTDDTGQTTRVIGRRRRIAIKIVFTAALTAVLQLAPTAVALAAPVVALEKTVEPTQIEIPGGIATYGLTVTNNGTQPFTIMSLTDTDYPGDTDPWSLLGTLVAPGETVWGTSCFGFGAFSEVDVVFANTAEIVVADALGATATAASTAYLGIGDVLPSVTLEKLVDFDGDWRFNDVSETGYAGSYATWKIIVRNTGVETRTNIVVTDTNGQTFTAGTLRQGQSRSWTYSTKVTADTVNTASVTAKTPAGTVVGPVQDSATAYVKSRGKLSIKKLVDFNGDGCFSDSFETNRAGRTACWKIVVKNADAVTLYNIVITDSIGRSFTVDRLTAFGSKTFTYSTVIIATVVNTASAVAKDPYGLTVDSGSDSAEARVR
jgi:uncharacterized repeat protein (TIGR01451 family)